MLPNMFPKSLFDWRNVRVLFSKSLWQVLCKQQNAYHHCPLFRTKSINLFPPCPNFPLVPAFICCQPKRYIVNQAPHPYNVSELVVSIKEKATHVDKMIASVPDKTICSYITILEGLNMPLDGIKALLGDNPELLKIPVKNWQNVLKTLNDYGIKNKPMLKTLHNYPLILGQNPNQLSTVFNSLRTLKISDNSLRQMITHNPEIVSFEPNLLVKRARELQTLFKMDDVILFIRKSPHILTEDWEMIRKKFNYVFSEMGITQPQMRYSNLFHHSLDHIRTRHLWVYRTGFFKKSKHKEEKQLNPRLDTILDLSDKEFAEKFGNMSKKDYQTFCKLLQQEIEDDYDDDEGYDSDDDDDDDDDDEDDDDK
ncbi:transcription termination factor 4, mitochondrial isoform X3 [Octopus sinensis]|uniref:Transcription termination factor 4, mitochondrial isoform X3 n=1 Tax=Octopus sinensis TaxID=2607531 RepID=A0A7E6FGT7_9MOLL|nr:transcription termination factor 4, mitochondrial isoform X3 [Octopus sinensis]